MRVMGLTVEVVKHVLKMSHSSEMIDTQPHWPQNSNNYSTVVKTDRHTVRWSQFCMRKTSDWSTITSSRDERKSNSRDFSLVAGGMTGLSLTQKLRGRSYAGYSPLCSNDGPKTKWRGNNDVRAIELRVELYDISPHGDPKSEAVVNITSKHCLERG